MELDAHRAQADLARVEEARRPGYGNAAEARLAVLDAAEELAGAAKR